MRLQGKKTYDDYVANMKIQGHEATAAWYVNDLKISHKYLDVVIRIIKIFERVYGKINPLTVGRGQLHKFLGTALDYRTERKVRVNMFDYINKS